MDARNHIGFAFRALDNCAALSQSNVEERSCFELGQTRTLLSSKFSTRQKRFQFGPIFRTHRIRNRSDPTILTEFVFDDEHLCKSVHSRLHTQSENRRGADPPFYTVIRG